MIRPLKTCNISLSLLVHSDFLFLLLFSPGKLLFAPGLLRCQLIQIFLILRLEVQALLLAQRLELREAALLQFLCRCLHLQPILLLGRDVNLAAILGSLLRALAQLGVDLGHLLLQIEEDQHHKDDHCEDHIGAVVCKKDPAVDRIVLLEELATPFTISGER